MRSLDVRNLLTQRKIIKDRLDDGHFLLHRINEKGRSSCRKRKRDAGEAPS